MVALPAHYYRDPALTARFKAETPCSSCAHERTLINKPYCGLGRRYGRRCKLYKENL